MDDDFVVDNSIVMAWCFEDETNTDTERILDRLETSTAFVPAIWPLELTNVLVMAERRKRISQADSARFIALVGELPIIVEQESPGRMLTEILALARSHQLSTYDASYLDLAMRKGLPLATQDKNLINAAERCNVILI